MGKAYQNLSLCQNFPNGQPCQKFPTGQPAKLDGYFFWESLPKPVAMPELSNWSDMLPEPSNWLASNACGGVFFWKAYENLSPWQIFQTDQIAKLVGVFFCGKFTKTGRHARTFHQVSHVRTFQLVSQQSVIGDFLRKAYQNLSLCLNFPTGQPCCQNLPTG